jgi:hypothetical protein
MIIEKLNNNVVGHYIKISDIKNGYWITEIYEGYTKKKAKQLFKNKHYA